MIIFGTRGVTYNVESGSFPCPGCRTNPAGYTHKRVRRFFTLYFIPVIPLDMLGEYVECAECASTWKPDVLQLAAEADNERKAVVAEYKRVMLRVMVQMMMADGDMDDAEVAVVRDIYEKIGGEPLSDEAVAAQVAGLADGESLEETCRKAGSVLNDKGKVLVLQSALDVAYADGEFQEAEREMVAAIAKALDMRPTDVSMVMDAAA